jgi:4-amino-4-deoxy-L-arabinose transferase-like glycosyltransferase
MKKTLDPIIKSSYHKLLHSRITYLWVVGISVIIQVPMLFFNLSEGDSFRFAQTTMVVREFINNGIDFRTPLPVFGSNSFVPFELPLFQSIASIIAKLLALDPLVATRFTALLFFQGTCVVTYALSKKWFGKEVALIVVLLFEFTPFGLRFAHSPLMEFAATFYFLLSVYLFGLFIENSKTKIKFIIALAAALSLSAGFLTKVTTGIALLPIFLILVLKIFSSDFSKIKKSISILVLIFSTFGSLLMVVLWNSFADTVKAQNPFTAHLISTTPQMVNWNFGTLQDRLDPKSWVTIYFQYLGPITSGLLVMMLLTYFAIIHFEKKVIVPLIFVPILGPLLFINLYRSHQYYVSALYPVLIILLSSGIYAVSKKFGNNQRFASYILVLILITSSISTKVGLNYMSDLFNHSDVPPLVHEIRQTVPSGDHVLFLGCDWNPEIPYYAETSSLMIPEWGISPNPRDLQVIKYIVFCDFVQLDKEQMFRKYFGDREAPIQVSTNIYKLGSNKVTK